MYGVTNVQSYQVTKGCISRLSHAKVPKIDNASVLNRNISMFSDTLEDKVSECQTEKSKHLQQWKNFGTADRII